METIASFLTPGQWFAQPGDDRRIDQPVAVERLDRDPLGFPRVIFRCSDGRQLTAYAAQIEWAVAEGQLAPISGAGCAGGCC